MIARNGFALLVCLAAPVAVQAGGILEVVPDDPGTYFPGESVSLEVWLHNQDTEAHELRLVSLDMSVATAMVYAIGWFATAGGIETNYIANWDGNNNLWRTLGAGLNVAPGESGPVVGFSTHFFDDGTGQALYVAGNFDTAGGITTNRIARWDGSDWSNLGSGMDDTVRTLAPYDDGTGSALYAGGVFTQAGGVAADHDVPSHRAI